MQTLIYEMEMDEFGISRLRNDPSFNIEILYELEDDPKDSLPLKYKVRVIEIREHEDGDGTPEWVDLSGQ